MNVRTAVIPVAGLGTRLLPATKAIPKELVPIVNRPSVQWVVEDAVRAGITDVVFVTSQGKSAIEDHFDQSAELERALAAKDRRELLDAVRHASTLARFASVRQPEPLGLGHAVLMAASVVGREPFAVILPDELVQAPKPALAQCLETAAAKSSTVIGLVEVAPEETSRYGIVDASDRDGPTCRIDDLVEKPAPGDAPSRLAITGPYVLTPEVFDELERVPPGAGGEIQLTDALRALAARAPVHGRLIEGRRLDVGRPLGFVQANVVLGLADPEIGEPLRAWLRRLLAEE